MREIPEQLAHGNKHGSENPCGLFLITGPCDPLAVSTFNEAIEIVNLDEIPNLDVSDEGLKAAIAQNVQTSTFGFGRWGPPVPSWPAKFCSWDYWTTAAWEITFVGKKGVCRGGESCRALAGLASRAIATNMGIQAMLRGVAWTPVTTTSVLCQARAGQLVYTVRLEAPSSAMAKFRTSSGTKMMKSLLNPTNVRSLKLPGTTTHQSYSVTLDADRFTTRVSCMRALPGWDHLSTQ